MVRDSLPPSARYPVRMRFLRRREAAPRSASGGAFDGRRAGAARAGRGDEPDWRTYDGVAEAYERAQAPRTGPVAQDLVGMAGLQPGQRVLDLGTGTGVLARAAAGVIGADGIVVGVDASVPMLLAAAPGGAHYVAAEAIDLPFRDATFHAVLSSFVLSHFTKYDTALFDMMRVLKPNGTFGSATWGRTEDEFQRTWSEVAFEYAEREMLQDAKERAMPWEERFSDAVRLKDILHEAGVRDMVVDKREYRFQMTRDDYLMAREITATGRFLHEMLGGELWQTFRARVGDVFAERFPERLNDFREVILVVGRKGT
jgi:ubiquinone/menaquinone biosynthesis C-methylase UbiE